MKNLQRVVWAKGMLLTPQHFQAAFNQMEDSLQHRFTSSHFENWGATRVEFSETALSKGVFELTRFEGVMGDGTLLSCPGCDPLPPSFPFAAHFGTAIDYLDIHLGIRNRDYGQNVDLEAASRTEPGSPANQEVRYRARLREVRDENGLDEDKEVLFAQRNLMILLGEIDGKGYDSIRLARIRRTSAGGYEAAPDVIPPLLNIGENAFLRDLVTRQIDLLETKWTNLAGAGRQRAGAGGLNLSEAQRLWLLQTVCSFLPELTHVWNVRKGHPEMLFLTMLRLAGCLAALSPEEDLRRFPRYEHKNLGFCFSELDKRILSLLEKAVPSKCISIPLKEKQGIWTGAFTNEGWLKGSQLYLEIRGDMGAEEIIRLVPKLVKAAPPEEIETMVRYATPGLTLRHLTPPSGVPDHLGSQYFGLNQAGRLWEGVLKSRALSLFLPADLAAAKPELYVLLP